MATFAKVNQNNIVERVVKVSNEYDIRGKEYLDEIGLTGSCWIQTSVNTRRGVHIAGGTPLRKNYAMIGYSYDPILNAFIPPKPKSNPSWIIDEQTGMWIPPVSYPTDGKRYIWDELSVNWILLENQ